MASSSDPSMPESARPADSVAQNEPVLGLSRADAAESSTDPALASPPGEVGAERFAHPNVARCPCGFGRDHRMIKPVGRYTLGGWAGMIIGVSVRPIRIDYQCSRCHHVVGSTTDAEVLRKLV